MKKEPNIIVLDSEWAPSIVYAWDFSKQRIHHTRVKEEGFMLMLQWKELGGRKVYTKSIPDFKQAFKEDYKDDKELIKFTLDLLGSADIVIGQNLDKFDIPMINARAIYHGLDPVGHYQTIDTLKESRKIARNKSHALDYLNKLYGGEGKLDCGMDTLISCRRGDTKAYKKLALYGKKDVQDTEDLYYRLRPWMKTHPTLGLFDAEAERTCPRCGSHNLHISKYLRQKAGTYVQYKCQDCKGYSKDPKRVEDTTKVKKLMRV